MASTSKDYFVRFSSGNPQTSTGLAPTFLAFFKTADGTSITKPGFTEILSGSGLYRFQATPSFQIAFIADGATTGLPNDVRFVAGQIGPNDDLSDDLAALSSTFTAFGSTFGGFNSTFVAFSSTFNALNSSLIAGIGSTTSSFGTDSVDPSTLFGYLKRAQEVLEGNQIFNKSTGIWDIYSRGSSQLLREKTLAVSASTVTKT